ncbi:hypothetical protein H5410_001145 [Solanum commersonii]|uniref:Uncharacterized protein n=1 Tax=Solanum commersonii TaxID=4109 RepID=A0A9J6AYA6_SOLCO|nr:hypothetical protein H5410_001145 [Solanum commersonii]
MNQSTILKKKGSIPNKAQSPLKNLDADMQYRSSIELVNTFKIKREHVANERNNKAKKEHEELSTSHMIVGKGQNKSRLFQSGESIQEKEFKLHMHNFKFQTSSKEGVTSSVHVTGTTLVDIEYMHAPSIHEHNKGLDALEDQEEIGEDECAIDEEVDIDYSTKGQAVGSTDKIVLELTNFIGTIARNPRFINLMYTSWHAVPKDIKIKKRMWEYINSKFPILVEGKKRHKQKIKERCFDKNSTVEDMLAKHLDDISKAQFCQLIEYWKHPTVQYKDILNIFYFEFFAGRKTELQNCQNSGETTDDAFRAVFGKEQPNRLRCYGKSVITSSLKEDEETNKLKQKHANEINILGVVGSNLVSLVDASSAQAVRGQNIPHSLGSTHDSVIQKLWLQPVVLAW